LKDLSKRLLTACVAIPLLIILFFAGGIPFLFLICAIVFLGVWEYYKLADAGPKMHLGWREKSCGLAASIVFPLTAYTASETELLAVVVAFLCVGGVIRLSVKDSTKSAIPALSTLIFGPLFIGFLLSHAILLRERLDNGTFFLFLPVACTMLSDSGAYFGGRAFGRHPLAPSVSPKKTMEGGILGVLTGPPAALAVQAVHTLFGGQASLPMGHLLFLGLLIGIASLFGDLVESLMKRGAGVKDSGWLFPGHGGVLDRLDSLLFSVPLTYYYVRFVDLTS